MEQITFSPRLIMYRTMSRSLIRVLADWGQTWRQWPHRTQWSGMISARSSLIWIAFTSQFRTHL